MIAFKRWAEFWWSEGNKMSVLYTDTQVGILGNHTHGIESII